MLRLENGFTWFRFEARLSGARDVRESGQGGRGPLVQQGPEQGPGECDPVWIPDRVEQPLCSGWQSRGKGRWRTATAFSQ